MASHIQKSINSLKQDNNHGAGYLTEQALKILRTAIIESAALSINKLTGEVDSVADALINARPGMVSIANYAIQFKEALDAVALKSRTPESLKKKGIIIAESLFRYSEKSSQFTARNAVKLIGRHNIVMTCSYSSAVCNTLKRARHNGIDFKVLVVESDHNKISYGEMTANELKKSGIIYRLVPDSQIRWQMARADIVLTGADAVSLHGWIINGTPSLELVQIARRRRKPIYSICEIAKFDVRGFLTGTRESEPGFDAVPLELFGGIVTEAGFLKTDDILAFTINDLFRSQRVKPG